MTDRLDALICCTVVYTVNDEDGTYTGTVERDSSGRPYINGTDGAVVYDTGILKDVQEVAK